MQHQPESDELAKKIKVSFRRLFTTAVENTHDKVNVYRDFQLSLKPFLVSKSFISEPLRKHEVISEDAMIGAFTNVARGLWKSPTSILLENERYLDSLIRRSVKDALLTNTALRSRSKSPARSILERSVRAIQGGGADKEPTRRFEQSASEIEEEPAFYGGQDDAKNTSGSLDDGGDVKEIEYANDDEPEYKNNKELLEKPMYQSDEEEEEEEEPTYGGRYEEEPTLEEEDGNGGEEEDDNEEEEAQGDDDMEPSQGEDEEAPLEGGAHSFMYENVIIEQNDLPPPPVILPAQPMTSDNDNDYITIVKDVEEEPITKPMKKTATTWLHHFLEKREQYKRATSLSYVGA